MALEELDAEGKLQLVLQENNDLKEQIKKEQDQVKDLEIRLEYRCMQLKEKEEEMESLRTALYEINIKLIKTTVECLENTETVNSKQRRLEEQEELNRLISDKIIGLTHNQSNLSVELINYKYKLAHLTEQISEATTELSQVKEERDRLAKQLQKMKASRHRSALEEPEDEEKQILITQVNAYSRECDKLKGQLQTAHDESVALREEVVRLNDDNQLLRNNERRLREELEIQRDDTSALMRKYTEDRKKIEEDNEILHAKSNRYEENCKILQRANEELKNEMEELKNEMEEVKELKNKQCSIIESLLKDRRIDTPSKELTQSRSRNRLPSPSHAGVKEEDLGRPPGPESDYRVKNSSSSHNGPTGRRIKYSSQEDSKDIEEMADKVRKEQRPPTTQEIFSDDGSRPYDPNLVCPKCGRQYREGEIQRLRRHINEFCIGKR